ncbi:MAG: epoxyqueuosine reductase QueH [Candidatus Omnitrophica bacterium]|nr:epoxyqueuosine reductase QueH [Candidatus Omnitrophota bacterium]
MQKIVLHFCCGPCGAGVIETLSAQFKITGYFYNPNIWPKEEYERRLGSAKKIAKVMKIEMIAGPYENFVFGEKVKNLTREKEGGKRCLLCYRIRLEKTAAFAKENGIDIFTTTLSISPHKKADSINAIGVEIAKAHGLNFYEADFKKNNGFAKSVRLSKESGLYRQKYCGCQDSAKIK